MKAKILANGLNSIVVKNPSSDVVSLQLWVSCGSVCESDKEYGVSHFIEHLLFKGTEKHGVGEVAREVESLGGDLNAFTAKEYTCYYITLSSMHMEKGLSILKDLVFCPTFIQEEIDSEREVIVEEIRRYQDMPGSVASDNFFDIHFKGHPYSRPILGYEKIIRSITRDEIKGYYSKFYTPSNCILIVCGNVDTVDKTFGVIDKTFGDLRTAERVKCSVSEVRPKTNKSCKVQTMDVNELNIVFGFPIPGLMHEDIPALDVLGIVLGQGDSSRLVKALRVEQGIVTYISSYAYTPKYGGAFNISFSLDGTSGKSESRIKSILTSIYEEIEKLKNNINMDEIEKAKTILLSDKVYEREKVEGLASKLGHLISTTGGVEFEKQYFDGLRKIQKSDIISMLGKYMDTSKVSISAVVPKQEKIDDKSLAKIFDESFKLSGVVSSAAKEESKAYESRSSVVDSITADNDYDFSSNIIVEVPKIIKHPSGARIIVRKMSATPLVSMKILMPGGVLYENDSNQGISNLMARTLTFGADDLSFSDLANIIDSTASSLNSFSGRNSIGLSIDVMKPFFMDILSVTSKILLKPNFKQEYFDNEKKIIEDEIRATEDNLGQYSKQLLLKTMYKEHPYRFEILGTIDNVRKFKRSDVMDFYKMLLSPERMIFSVVGDFDEQQLLNWVDDTISKISRDSAALPVVREEPAQTENRIAKFKKESKQAHIFIAYKTCGLRSNDKYALSLLDAILGGQSGRLFLDLRDKQSLAYTVAPVELYGPDTGYFGAYIASENSKIDKAIDEIRKQISRVKSEKISEDEMERAKNFIIGRHAISMQSFSEQSTTMGFDEMFGNGYDSMFAYSRDILAVTANDIKLVANKYFKDGAENTAVVSG